MSDPSAMRTRYQTIRTAIAALRIDMTALRDELDTLSDDERDSVGIVIADMVTGMEQETATLLAEAREILAHVKDTQE